MLEFVILGDWMAAMKLQSESLMVCFWFLPRPTSTDTGACLLRVQLKNLGMQKAAWYSNARCS